MKSVLIAVPMMMVALAAGAQTVPSMPKMPTDQAPMAAPGATATTPAAPSGTSIPGTSQPSSDNPIDKAKTEAECKLPTNATKPECVELMLKK